MGLEDFEKELAAQRSSHKDNDRDRGVDRQRSSHHRSSRREDDEKDGHRRRKRSRDREDGHRHDNHKSKRRRTESSNRKAEVQVDDGEDEWVEKETMTAPPEEDILDKRDVNLKDSNLKRDSWMQAPSALDVDYVQQNRRKKSPPSQFVSAKEDHDKNLHQQDMEMLAKDLQEEEEDDDNDHDGAANDQTHGVVDVPAQHDVSYVFGDSGSQWRMTKLKAVYRQAKESAKSVEEVALNRYGSLREFDDAREEERELDRREVYGKGYVGLETPSGDLYQDRKMAEGIRHHHHDNEEAEGMEMSTAGQDARMQEAQAQTRTVPLDATALNKLKAKLMKAKLRKDPDIAALEQEYNDALAASSNTKSSDVVVLSNMDNRMLAGGRGNEVKTIDTKRGQARGQVTENNDMSIEDMIRQERRTRNTGYGNEGLLLANSIARDSKLSNDLDYLNDNAASLAKRTAQSESSLRSSAISSFQKQSAIITSCPLCHHEDSPHDPLPTAPIISLGTRTFLTLTPSPSLTTYSAVISPISHHSNLLECDEDEWEEIRNFMKSLTRFYAGMLKRGVIFYENAARPQRNQHAALTAVPISYHHLDLAPGFFKEAILSSDEEWSQHVKIIDTAKGAREKFGKAAFRKMLVKEVPYFHVWFGMDGGLGHVVEDEKRWPKGDLFAREVLGGMLDCPLDVIKKQGRWIRRDERVDGFKRIWDEFDWTKILVDASV